MSATATINRRAPAQPSAKSIPGLPATSRLLPRLPTEEAETEHPPIYMKLNSSILSLLADGSDAPKITLEVSEKTKSLRIGNFEYQGSLYKEPGYSEVYLPENCHGGDGQSKAQPLFRSHGQVRNRMTIKQDKPLKVPQYSEPVDLTQPTEQRILHILKLGPAQAQDIAAKVQTSRELVDAVIAQVAEPRVARSTHYVLKKEFQQNLQAQEDNTVSSTPPKGQQKQRQVDAPVKPERITKTLKELREARAATKPATGTPPVVSTLSDGSANTNSSASEEVNKGSDGGEKKASSVPADISGPKDRLKIAVKRRAPVSTYNPSKRSRPETPEGLPMRPGAVKQKEGLKEGLEEDMYEMARKFKNAYGEYLELYTLLSKRKARPASQVEKLITMHRQLERWKNTLWTNARNKRMVN